jgi:hypothetical protein
MAPGSLALPTACATCGRQPIVRPAQVAIDATSVPQGHDVFRLADLTTMIVATERAVDVLAASGLRGFHFEPFCFECPDKRRGGS